MYATCSYSFSFEPRVENLKKFKSDDGDCPTLVCTDLAARGLDLDVDHVIMFDFPSNSVSITSMAFYSVPLSISPFSFLFFFSFEFYVGYSINFSLQFQIDYLHRTGRTARMGAKGNKYLLNLFIHFPKLKICLLFYDL